MIHVRGSVFLKASDAGADLRPLGFAPRGRSAWRTLAGPMRLGAKKPGKDLVGKDLFDWEPMSRWRRARPCPVLRRSGDLSEEPRTRSHLELGR